MFSIRSRALFAFALLLALFAFASSERVAKPTPVAVVSSTSSDGTSYASVTQLGAFLDKTYRLASGSVKASYNSLKACPCSREYVKKAEDVVMDVWSNVDMYVVPVVSKAYVVATQEMEAARRIAKNLGVCDAVDQHFLKYVRIAADFVSTKLDKFVSFLPADAAPLMPKALLDRLVTFAVLLFVSTRVLGLLKKGLCFSWSVTRTTLRLLTCGLCCGRRDNKAAHKKGKKVDSSSNKKHEPADNVSHDTTSSIPLRRRH